MEANSARTNGNTYAAWNENSNASYSGWLSASTEDRTTWKGGDDKRVNNDIEHWIETNLGLDTADLTDEELFNLLRFLEDSSQGVLYWENDTLTLAGGATELNFYNSDSGSASDYVDSLISSSSSDGNTGTIDIRVAKDESGNEISLGHNVTDGDISAMREAGFIQVNDDGSMTWTGTAQNFGEFLGTPEGKAWANANPVAAKIIISNVFELTTDGFGENVTGNDIYAMLLAGVATIGENGELIASGTPEMMSDFLASDAGKQWTERNPVAAGNLTQGKAQASDENAGTPSIQVAKDASGNDVPLGHNVTDADINAMAAAGLIQVNDDGSITWTGTAQNVGEFLGTPEGKAWANANPEAAKIMISNVLNSTEGFGANLQADDVYAMLMAGVVSLDAQGNLVHTKDAEKVSNFLASDAGLSWANRNPEAAKIMISNVLNSTEGFGANLKADDVYAMLMAGVVSLDAQGNLVHTNDSEKVSSFLASHAGLSWANRNPEAAKIMISNVLNSTDGFGANLKADDVYAMLMAGVVSLDAQGNLVHTNDSEKVSSFLASDAGKSWASRNPVAAEIMRNNVS